MLSLEAARDTFRQFFNPYQLFFITPYTAYTGFNLGFVLSEATRAYGSCLLGVNQVCQSMPDDKTAIAFVSSDAQLGNLIFSALKCHTPVIQMLAFTKYGPS